ncbi:MAG: GNAT family N-acetyltransferase [Ruoffia tabacinasalis]|nr:GNAT family N-acetyltransferase [Aerococcaceae bacterium]
MGLTVRKARIDDAMTIGKIQVSSWQSTYQGVVSDEVLNNMSLNNSVDRWKSILERDALTYVLEKDKEVVGYISGGLQRKDSYPAYKGELHSIYLSRSAQGLGGGRLLVDTLVKKFKTIGIRSMIVIVFSGNARSIRFYKNLGGEFIGIETIKIENQILEEQVYGFKFTNNE